MELGHSMRDGCVVVTLTGRIDLLAASWVQRVLRKELAERPYAVICDLSGVEWIDPVCASLFSAVAGHPARDWPATAFLLCCARPAVAAVLAGTLVPTTVAGHPYWQIQDPAARRQQRIHFYKNVGLFGGALLVLSERRRR